MKKLNISLSLFFVFISVAGIYLSSKLPTFGDEDSIIFSMKPSFYPTIIFSLLLLSSGFLFIRTLLKSDFDFIHIFNSKAVVILVFYILYIFMIMFLQFIASTIVFFMLCSFYLLADRNKNNFILLPIVNVLSTVILYILFVVVLNVPI